MGTVPYAITKVTAKVVAKVTEESKVMQKEDNEISI